MQERAEQLASSIYIQGYVPAHAWERGKQPAVTLRDATGAGFRRELTPAEALTLADVIITEALFAAPALALAKQRVERERDEYRAAAEAAKALLAQANTAFEGERAEVARLRAELGAISETVGDKCDDLEAIHALVAPGNHQGTALDAVRARFADLAKQRDDAYAHATAQNGELDTTRARAAKAEADLARIVEHIIRQLPTYYHDDGTPVADLDEVIEFAGAEIREARVERCEADASLEKAERDVVAATARAEKAERERATTNDEIKKLHNVIKSKGFSVEDSVALASFRDEAAKLRAEIAGALAGLAALLPVTPPSLAAAVDAVRDAWAADRDAGARAAAEAAELRKRQVVTRAHVDAALVAVRLRAVDRYGRVVPFERLCAEFHGAVLDDFMRALGTVTLPAPAAAPAPTHICGQCQKPVPAPAAACRDHEWIGVDLDGTLAHHDTWRGLEHIGAPVPAMLARVKEWRARGVGVRILTARVSDLAQSTRARRVVEAWCLEHVGEVLPVTCVKDMHMVELWDDRAVRVGKNTGEPFPPNPVEFTVAEIDALALAYLKERNGGEEFDVAFANAVTREKIRAGIRAVLKGARVTA